MGALFRPDEPESFILYIDAINLYGWAMSQTLPYSEFEWQSDAQLLEVEIALKSDDWLVTAISLLSDATYSSIGGFYLQTQMAMLFHHFGKI